MPKQKTRYDGLDVAAATSYIRRHLLGHRVVNIYDGSALGRAGDG